MPKYADNQLKHISTKLLIVRVETVETLRYLVL